MYDLVIIGGGPAGVSAGVYAARKKLKTIFVTESIGGQSVDSVGVENWIGTVKATGPELAKMLEVHLRAVADDVVDIKLGLRATKVEKGMSHFLVHTGSEQVEARAVLIATGGVRKKLEVPGAAEFEHKGVTYCASCDGPIFAGQDVAVVGGGNAGFESAAQLLAYAKSVTMVHRGGECGKADKKTVDAVTKHPNFRLLLNTEPTEVKGETLVTSLVVKNKEMGKITELPASGVFVEIGMVPATDLVEGLIELDEWKRVKVDSKNQRTSVEGIWAAGDATNELYHQNNIAAGDGVKALEDIYYWLKRG